QYDISVKSGIKIYKKYGSETINMISENPYRLSEDVYGIGFKTADNIARKMGISFDSPFRIEAGLKYTMMSSAGEGHCYLPKEELLSKTSDMLEVDIDLVDDMLRELALNRNFHISNDLNNEIVYYMPFHVAENNVATKIVELSKVEFKEVEINIEKHIKEIGEEENIKFGKKQILAIEESLDSGVVVITGGPGTGKTTTIN